jgi:hypothetical protein
MTAAQQKVLEIIDANGHVGFGRVDPNANLGQVNIAAARALVRRGALIERMSPDGGPMFLRPEMDIFTGHRRTF